eukprot:g12208.t1
MFSTADRFEKEATEDSPGPGQYDLPSTLEGKGVTLDVSASRWSDLGHLEPWTRRARAEASEKGELVLGRWEKMGGGLASKLELVREEVKQKSKEAKELHLAMAAKDRKIEELSRKADAELSLLRRKAHEKDQEILSLQRKLEHSKAATKELCFRCHNALDLEEWSKRLEKRDEEQRNSQNELLSMRQSLETLQEQLSSTQRQQQRRTADLEGGLQSNIEFLEEQIAREIAKRKELEETWSKDAVEREKGEAALKVCQETVEDLQGQIEQLHSERQKDTEAAVRGPGLVGIIMIHHGSGKPPI